MPRVMGICVCIGLFVVFMYSGATGQQSPVDRDTNSSSINSLRWFVQNSRQVLQDQKDLNWNYGFEVKSLALKLAEIDSRLDDLQEATTFCQGLGKPQQVPQSELTDFL